MRKILIISAAMAIMLSFGSCASKSSMNKDTNRFRYDIECAGTGASGTYLVKVWSYSTDRKKAAQQAMKNAVHGVIFKGINGGNGCASQRALAANPGVEIEYQEYFNRFFNDDNGEYNKYASSTGAAPEEIKVNNEYKVGVVVVVHKDALRQALEAAGVIKGLNYGF